MLFGMLAVFLAAPLLSGKGEGMPLFIMVVPAAMAVFVFFLFKRLLWDLADEVMDAGDALVVRFRREEERIPLANIMNVSYESMTSPPRVTLLLRVPGRFGKEVSFAAPMSFVPLRKSPVIGELMERVDAARMAG